MMMHRRLDTGFTLLEVAFSIAILVVGTTAAIGMYMTGLKWAVDVKCNETAPMTASSVAEFPLIFDYDARNTGSPYAFTTGSEGWVNGYYAVRTVMSKEEVKDIAGNPTGGYLCEVVVDVFHGGDKDNGDLVYKAKRLINFPRP